jgi:hypothetical protein
LEQQLCYEYSIPLIYETKRADPSAHQLIHLLPCHCSYSQPTNRDLISYQDICAMHIAVNKRGKIGEILQGAT